MFNYDVNSIACDMLAMRTACAIGSGLQRSFFVEAEGTGVVNSGSILLGQDLSCKKQMLLLSEYKLTKNNWQMCYTTLARCYIIHAFDTCCPSGSSKCNVHTSYTVQYEHVIAEWDVVGASGVCE
jgi:hypothetical protein